MRRPSFRLLATLATGALWATAAGAVDPVSAASVYEDLAQRAVGRARSEYLRAAAGSPVSGSGRLEALSPRSFYDTSVPDSNPMVALIELEPGRKAACGLPRSVMDSLGWLRDGSPVAFEGRLVDAQQWDGSMTLYLTACTLSRR
ncbi:MAG: hypothetical protein HZB55_06460 [Deltaproteobacteria bacterium]|nr:hypothetical protein [Deltaproteobacteria bacterium]